MSRVCPNPGLERYFPPVGRSRIFPSFAGIAKSLRLFLSSCVSASRRPEERPGTLSRKRALAKVHKKFPGKEWAHHVLAAEGSELPTR